jgi:hypothetical protein
VNMFDSDYGLFEVDITQESSVDLCRIAFLEIVFQ